MFRIALICGGPSAERGISLNSARSVLDHLASETIEILPLYVDTQKNFYLISSSQLYSNTPADFDYKLDQSAHPLNHDHLISFLKTVDLAFPIIHGLFGEDGQLQEILEEAAVPFIGASSAACRQMFCKYTAGTVLAQNRFAKMPSLLLDANETVISNQVHAFFRQHQLKRAIIKPAIGGSSIGVSSVYSPEEAFLKARELFQKGTKKVLLEPFCEGKEFTIMVFTRLDGSPIALVPTEIEMSYQNNQIFDYRRKYLPTNQVAYHTPARFSDTQIQQIRYQAERLFNLFHMREFARLDGWLMPDGTIYFTDINPLSGLEQNSFLFRQASLLGLTHQQVLHHLLSCACQRWKKNCPPLENLNTDEKQRVHVLFGGKNAERQVSLMSGTNVWLKLLRSSRYCPIPFFYDQENSIWELPYAYTLDHTVEEIYSRCKAAEQKITDPPAYFKEIKEALNLNYLPHQDPFKYSLEEFLSYSSNQQAFVFIAMHGGEGEDGTLQKRLDEYRIPYNGSNSFTSHLCMDKYLTGQAIQKLADPFLLSIPKFCLNTQELLAYSQEQLVQIWEKVRFELKADQFIIKPRHDGCSAGIVLLESKDDFLRYLEFIKQKIAFIPKGSFKNQQDVIEMPSSWSGEYLIEPYIETDRISVDQHKLYHYPKKGWIELTVGVLEEEGRYHALNPSITIAEGAVLSLEEKFQGGTGINLTPPPESILPLEATQRIKIFIEKAAQALGIQNYARIDIFFNLLTGKIIVIEANTLPGLTPSTVLYHQGLAEDPPKPPIKLLEHLISTKMHPLACAQVEANAALCSK